METWLLVFSEDKMPDPITIVVVVIGSFTGVCAICGAFGKIWIRKPQSKFYEEHECDTCHGITKYKLVNTSQEKHD